MASKTASASDVRTWAAANGHEIKGERGRLSKAVIDAFNSAHRNKYAVTSRGYSSNTVKVTIKADGKPPVTRNVDYGAARAALVSAGVKVGTRGRLTSEQLQTAAGLL